MKFQLSGYLNITNTSCPNKHDPVRFMDNFQKRGLHFFNPAQCLHLPSPGPCHLGEFSLLLTAHVFWISRSQASLEMEIFGQIVFYARVGKEDVDGGGK